MEVFEVSFRFCTNSYTDKFYISDLADEFCKRDKKLRVAGILGNKFLKKNKWIIDYATQQIYSKK